MKYRIKLINKKGFLFIRFSYIYMESLSWFMKKSITFFAIKRYGLKYPSIQQVFYWKKILNYYWTKKNFLFIKKGNEINSEALLLFFYLSRPNFIGLILDFSIFFYYIYPLLLYPFSHVNRWYRINVTIELVLTFICGHIGAVWSGGLTYGSGIGVGTVMLSSTIII